MDFKPKNKANMNPPLSKDLVLDLLLCPLNKKQSLELT